MFDKDRKIKKNAKRLYRTLDPNIGPLVFKNGENEFKYVAFMLNKYICNNEIDMPKLLRLYASAKTYYLETGKNIVECIEYLKRKKLVGNVCKDIMAIVAVTEKKAVFNCEAVFENNSDIQEGRTIVQQAVVKAKRLAVVSILFDEQGMLCTDSELEHYTLLYATIRELLNYRLSYREIFWEVEILRNLLKDRSKPLEDAMKKASYCIDNVCDSAKYLSAYQKALLTIFLTYLTDTNGNLRFELITEAEDIKTRARGACEKCQSWFTDGFKFDSSQVGVLKSLGYEVYDERGMHIDCTDEEGRSYFVEIHTIHAVEINGDGTNDRDYSYSIQPNWRKEGEMYLAIDAATLNKRPDIDEILNNAYS